LGASDFGEIGIGGFQGGNQRVLEQFRQFPGLKGITEIKVVIFQGGHVGQNEVADGFLRSQGNRKILEAVIRTLIQLYEFQESV